MTLSLPLLDALYVDNPSAIALESLNAALCKSGSTWVKSQGHNLRSVAGAVSAELEGNLYWSSEQYGIAESYLANWISSRQRDITSHVPLKEAGLTVSQREAAKLVLSSPIACLSGLPGTGKTYTARAIANSIESSHQTILGCALTGIAASRLSKAAEIPATTIHRLLSWDGDKFNRGLINADCVIVDECSMVSPGLLLAICSRMQPGARLILIGDHNQLPSITPGETFKDLCSLLPHAHLTEVIRTEADSPLGHAALSILAGNVPQSEKSPTGIGGVWIALCESLHISTLGKRPRNHPLSIAEHMASMDETELKDVRTMAHSNDVVTIINCQFNRHRKVSRSTGRIPVMCLKNRHDLEIYNGDIGYRDYRTQVFGDRSVILRGSEQCDAWSTTVHKMQGQEALSAQIWLERTADRRLIYTALTRAKRRFIFTGNPDYLTESVQRQPVARVTLLRQFLTGEATLLKGDACK